MSTLLLSASDSAALDQYAFEQCVADHDVIFARMTLRASEVRARIKALDPSGRTRGQGLILFADTFILDDSLLPSPAVSIVARVIDLSAQSFPFFLAEKASRGIAMLEILHQRVSHGPLKIVSRSNPDDVWTLPAAARPPAAQVIACMDTEAAGTKPRSFEVDVSAEPRRIAEVATDPHVWNILKAQFAAASLLLGNSGTRADALSMLEWIAACSHAIASRDSEYRAEACQLNFQASSLLLLSNAPPNIRSVPVWSKEHLQRRITDLLEILGNHEAKVRAVETRQDIKSALTALSSSLADIAQADAAALQVAIDGNKQEIDFLWDQYRALHWTFELQAYDIKLAYSRFELGLKQAQVITTTTAILKLVGAVVQFAAAAYGVSYPDPKAAAAAAEAARAGVEEYQGEINNLAQLVWAAHKQDIIASLKGMKTYFEKIMVVGKAAAEAAKSAQQINVAASIMDRGAFGPIPELAEMAAMDPETEWNIFSHNVEVTMREFLENREGTGAITGAKEYYLNLRALAEYGRAVNLKGVALARAQSRALELAAQRQALRFASARWERLKADAQSDAEKLSLGKALLTEACLNTKRNILVMTEGYRAAYIYNQLKYPPLSDLSLSMDHAQLVEKYKGIKPDMDNFFATLAMPQSKDSGYFDFTIVAAGSTAPVTGPTATLHQPAGGLPASISWTMPVVNPPFEAGLNRTKCAAFFVQEAWFFLEGAAPDANGFIALRVESSGAYQNGYSNPSPPLPTPVTPLRFLTRGHEFDFTYKPGEDNKVYTPWKPDGLSKDNYLSPTPFSTWTATIEKAGSLAGLKTLRVRLALVYQNIALPLAT
jgi:hypothetical protein